MVCRRFLPEERAPLAEYVGAHDPCPLLGVFILASLLSRWPS